MIPDNRKGPPTAQTQEGEGLEAMKDWLELARRAYQGSTSYVDSNFRKGWEDSIRASNSEHPTDSKYTQPAYDKRSKIYRPRIRAIMRKNEAAAAAAFFSNMDVVSVTAMDQSNKAELASADVMKALLQYRLTQSIPWFQVVLGGLQDAQTMGVACAHIYWDYKEQAQPDLDDETEVSEPISGAGGDEDEYPAQELGPLPGASLIADKEGRYATPGEVQPVVKESKSATGKPVVKVDKPVVEIVPIENIRIDPAANWLDPINSSPYVIQMIPMYILDIKERMSTGEWIRHGDDVLGNATDTGFDSTRIARQRGSDDPYKSDNQSISNYNIAWVQRHIHRRGGDDWEFYTLSDVAMLSEPCLLKERVFHGRRPYVLGNCILETHRAYTSSVPQLARGLMDEINEIANQRIDNVKFVLNKKWFVKRGKEADVQGLVRNVPGGVVLLDDPQTDVKEVTWPDVTASSYQEAQTLNQELDELLGAFNPADLMRNGAAGNAPARNMALLSSASGTLVEYLLRTYVETFVQPVLRHIVWLERYYETDAVVMGLAGKAAQIEQRYGTDQVTDEMLNRDLTLTVNVGMGATDPMQKLQKFLTAMTTYTSMLEKPAPGINMQEVGKEIFGHLGYADGTRFFTNENPQILQMQQQMQQMQQMLGKLQQQVDDKKMKHQIEVAKAQDANATMLKKVQIQEEAANKRALASHFEAITRHMNPVQKVTL